MNALDALSLVVVITFMAGSVLIGLVAANRPLALHVKAARKERNRRLADRDAQSRLNDIRPSAAPAWQSLEHLVLSPDFLETQTILFGGLGHDKTCRSCYPTSRGESVMIQRKHQDNEWDDIDTYLRDNP